MALTKPRIGWFDINIDFLLPYLSLFILIYSYLSLFILTYPYLFLFIFILIYSYLYLSLFILIHPYLSLFHTMSILVYPPISDKGKLIVLLYMGAVCLLDVHLHQ